MLFNCEVDRGGGVTILVQELDEVSVIGTEPAVLVTFASEPDGVPKLVLRVVAPVVLVLEPGIVVLY